MLQTTDNIGLPNRGRSSARLQQNVLAAISPCLLYPIHHLPVVPGENVIFNRGYSLQTLPLTSPVYGRLRMIVDHFFVPFSAFSPSLRNSLYALNPASVDITGSLDLEYSYNRPIPTFIASKLSKLTGSGTGLPVAVFSEDPSNWLVQPGSLATYLGQPAYSLIPGDYDVITTGTSTTRLHAPNGISKQAFLSYLYCVYHYYMNPQAGSIPFTCNAHAGEASSFPLTSFDLSSVDSISSWSVSQLTSTLSSAQSGGLTSLVGFPSWFRQSMFSRNGGFFLAPMYRTLYNRFVSTENYSTVLTAGTISVTSDRLFVSDIISAEAYRNYAARYAAQNVSISEWINSEYGVTPPKDQTSPSFLARDEFFVDFNAVVATSSEGLGDLGGRGTGSLGSARRLRVNVKTPGLILSVAHLSPVLRNPYSLDRINQLSTMSDLPCSDLDALPYRSQTAAESFCSVMPFRYSATGTPSSDSQIYYLPPFSSGATNVPVIPYNPTSEIAGYVPFWTHFFGRHDTAYGDILTTLSHWSLSMNLAPDLGRTSVGALTGASITSLDRLRLFYFYPDQVNRIFPDTDLNSQNFIFQAIFDAQVRYPFRGPNFPQI